MLHLLPTNAIKFISSIKKFIFFSERNCRYINKSNAYAHIHKRRSDLWRIKHFEGYPKRVKSSSEMHSRSWKQRHSKVTAKYVPSAFCWTSKAIFIMCCHITATCGHNSTHKHLWIMYRAESYCRSGVEEQERGARGHTEEGQGTDWTHHTGSRKHQFRFVHPSPVCTCWCWPTALLHSYCCQFGQFAVQTAAKITAS